MEQNLCLVLNLTQTAREEINCVKAALMRTVPLQIWALGLLTEIYESFLAWINRQLVVDRAEVGRIPHI